MDRLGLAHARVSGLCSGTSIALALAAAAPARVDGLLLHTPFVRPGLIRGPIRAQLALLGSPLGALLGPLSRSRTLATLHRRVFANAAEVDAEQLAHDQSDLLRADVRANRELALDLLRVDRSATLASWRGPLGVLLARGDAFVDATATATAVRELAPQAVVEIIDGGHGWTPAFVRAQGDALARLARAVGPAS